MQTDTPSRYDIHEGNSNCTECYLPQEQDVSPDDKDSQPGHQAFPSI